MRAAMISLRRLPIVPPSGRALVPIDAAARPSAELTFRAAGTPWFGPRASHFEAVAVYARASRRGEEDPGMLRAVFA